MGLKKYLVLPFDGFDGIERGTDPPVGRRIYVPGDIIELDETVHGVAGLLAGGRIKPAPEDEAEEEPPTTSRSKVPG